VPYFVNADGYGNYTITIRESGRDEQTGQCLSALIACVYSLGALLEQVCPKKNNLVSHGFRYLETPGCPQPTECRKMRTSRKTRGLLIARYHFRTFGVR
jgi:hypothetical protein